jgi:3-hydroxyisobutyrate dehydrogenase-like beta-hydroxyacid dehydrogenase
LDSPVSGGIGAARNRTLTFLVGGKKLYYDKVENILRAIGKEIFYMGDAGSGSAAKLINNAIFCVNTIAIAEGLSLASKAGINLEALINALYCCSSNSYALNRNAPKVLANNYEAAFTMNLAVKDITLAMKMSEDVKHGVFSFPIAQQLLMEASNHFGSMDVASISLFLKFIKNRERTTGHDTVNSSLG